MKTLKSILVSIGISTVIMLLVSFGYRVALSSIETNRYKTPPTGWAIVTDGDGHFGAMYPSGYVIDSELGAPITSQQQAIDIAWSQVEFQFQMLQKAAKEDAPTKSKNWTAVNQ